MSERGRNRIARRGSTACQQSGSVSKFLPDSGLCSDLYRINEFECDRRPIRTAVALSRLEKDCERLERALRI